MNIKLLEVREGGIYFVETLRGGPRSNLLFV